MRPMRRVKKSLPDTGEPRDLASFSRTVMNYMPQWLQTLTNSWDWGDGREDKRMSTDKALTYAPIWYGVNKIAGHIAQLPINVYRRLDRGAERDRRHFVHHLMRRPNVYQTSIVFREQVATHSLLDGNGRAAIVKQDGRITELIPLLPECSVTVMINGVKVHGSNPSADDRLRLFFKPMEGDTRERSMIQLEDREVIHIPGLSLNGITGVALRDIAARNLGASIDAERRLASQMENGFSGSLMLEAPPGMFKDQKQAAEFLEGFEKRHHDKNKAGKPGLLREGMKANLIQMNNRDAEMIDNRRFQRQDAALYLGLESILGDDASVSYNSLEQKNLGYLQNCLNRWLKRWEEELEYKLLPPRQYLNETHYIKFNTAALLKSDFQTTVASLGSLVTTTIFSRNEAREKLDMNPVPGGDVYENPAITPGVAEPEEKTPPKEENTSKAAIESHISHFIGVEANRVKEAAGKVKGFAKWLDNFYAKKWESNFADNLEEIGIDRDESRIHCDESKRQLLAVCLESTPEELAANVAICTSNWKSRAKAIGDRNV